MRTSIMTLLQAENITIVKVVKSDFSQERALNVTLLSLCSVSLNFISYADNTSIQDKGGIVSFSLFFH